MRDPGLLSDWRGCAIRLSADLHNAGAAHRQGED